MREYGLKVATFFDLLNEARNLGFYVNSSDYVCVCVCVCVAQILKYCSLGKAYKAGDQSFT